ncbi:MAG: deoxyribose-phosphate aldolase [Clostridia bacterium]
MEISNILKATDHTLLTQTATENQIKKACDEAVKFKTASICIAPNFVKIAKQYVEFKVPICTVIGFPNGYNKTQVKVFEAQTALEDGAKELDMVINLGDVKGGKYSEVLKEIKTIAEICHEEHKILKVIIETCLLTEDEKKHMCEIVTMSGADFIKTSTGFSNNGATKADIILFKKYCGENLKIKAAGGIKTLSDAQEFLNLGADRLGTSKIINLIKNL